MFNVTDNFSVWERCFLAVICVWIGILLYGKPNDSFDFGKFMGILLYLYAVYCLHDVFVIAAMILFVVIILCFIASITFTIPGAIIFGAFIIAYGNKHNWF
jgi:energy-converting hydrogenase Eha subunit B